MTNQNRRPSPPPPHLLVAGDPAYHPLPLRPHPHRHTKGGDSVKRVTQTAVLARAISDCAVSVRDAEARMEELAKKKADIEAAFFHEQILRPLKEELATLKTLYEIETGTPYEIDPAD